MSIIANHPQPQQEELANIEFFPALNVEEFSSRYRIDGKTDQTLLVQSLLSNMMEVNDELQTWMEGKVEEGYASIGAIPAKKYNNQSELIIAYKQAVYARTKADIMRHFGNYDLTDDGDDKWQNNDQQARFYDRESTKAIRKIKDRSTTTVSLI